MPNPAYHKCRLSRRRKNLELFHVCKDSITNQLVCAQAYVLCNTDYKWCQCEQIHVCSVVTFRLNRIETVRHSVSFTPLLPLSSSAHQEVFFKKCSFKRSVHQEVLIKRCSSRIVHQEVSIKKCSSRSNHQELFIKKCSSRSVHQEVFIKKCSSRSVH